jgi:hypothetical protein
MTTTRTWKDAIAEAEKRLFVGRERELSDFLAEAQRQPPRSLIFFISGQGGVGKTTLLNRYRETAEAIAFVTAVVDEHAADVPSVLGRLSEQLEVAGHRLSGFSALFSTYRQRRAEIEADPDAPKGMAALLGRGLVRGSLLLCDAIPVVRQGVDLLDQASLEKAAGDWLGYLAKRLTNRDEIALLHDPVSLLSTAFFEDVNTIARRQRLLLCMDNFEVMRAYLEEWLLGLSQLSLSDAIRFAIGGRTPPGPNWDRLLSVVHHIPLDVFSDEEAERFLDITGIQDVDRRREILTASGRLPVMMSLLASAQGHEPDTSVPTSDVVGRFLRWIHEADLRQVALLAALPTRFNLDVLRVLLSVDGAPSDDVERQFDWLRQRPFVSEDQQGWKYHDVVRLYMLRYQRQASRDTYRALHRRLIAFYEEQRQSLSIPSSETWRHRRWRDYTLEIVCHRVAADPEEGCSEVLNL